MDGKTSAEQLLASGIFKDYDNSWVQKPTPAQKLALRQQPEPDEEEGLDHDSQD